MIMYSGKAVGRAGNILRKSDFKTSGPEFENAINTLSYWRSIHEKPLADAMIFVQKIVTPIDKKAVFAKRPKRTPSIINKLKRFEKMSLRNMNDIGGCRVIVSNQKVLKKAIKQVRRHKNYFGPSHAVDFRDYLKNPKDDGYRGFHLMGRFEGSDGKKRVIEIQFRTVIQHSWATSVEIVDIFTNQTLKSSSGDKKWAYFFENVSKLLTKIESLVPDERQYTSEQIQDRYVDCLDGDLELQNVHKVVVDLTKSLKVIERFKAFTGSVDFVSEVLDSNATVSGGYVLLEVNTKSKILKSNFFESGRSEDAVDQYTVRERSNRHKKDIVVALVSTTAIGGIKEAYPNYFADATIFIHYLTLFSSITIEDQLKDKIFKYFTGVNYKDVS